MSQPAQIARAVLLTVVCILASHNSVTNASRPQYSLLQVKRSTPTWAPLYSESSVSDSSTDQFSMLEKASPNWAPTWAPLEFSKLEEASCPLPADGAWAEVRLVGLPPFQMAVRKSNDPLSDHLLQGKGYWEIEDVSVWGKPGEALDIGGNIGYYSFALAQAGWHVTTFEPMGRNIEFIKATLCRNPEIASRIKLLGFGLGTKSQQCSIITLPDNIGNGCVRCSGDVNKGASYADPWDESKYVSAGSKFEIHRLEQVLKDEKISKVDFVKLDVEGYECEAIKGAGKFLETYRPRLVKSEVWQSMERCSATEYLTMFQDAGYRFGWDPDYKCSEGAQVKDMSYGGNFYMCSIGEP